MDSEKLTKGIDCLKLDAILWLAQQRYGGIPSNRPDILARISFRIKRGDPLEVIFRQCIPWNREGYPPASVLRRTLQRMEHLVATVPGIIRKALGSFRRS